MRGRMLVLGCSVVILATTTSTAGQAASRPQTLGSPREVVLPAPLINNVAALPAARPATTDRPARPFLPHDAQKHAQAKRDAATGAVGRRSGVAALGHAVASSAGVRIPTEAAGFPLVNRTQQIGWFGGDQNVEPPDTQIAAGGSFLAAMDNDTGTIWSKNGTLLSRFDLNVFFGVQGIGFFLSDPRVLYDVGSGRWFASATAFNPSFNSTVLLAVSTSADPTTSWNIFTLRPPTAVLFDQPMTGISDDKVVVSWNDYSSTTKAFLDTQTFVLEKADLVAGQAPRAVVFTNTATFRIVPARSVGMTTTAWAAFDNGQGGSIGVISFTGTPAANNVVGTLFTLTTALTAAPPNAEQPGPGTPPTIDTGDDRFTSAVWQEGHLWVSGNDACTPAGDVRARSCMRLMEVGTTGATPTVEQNFDAGRAGSYLYYPAVAPDANFDLFVVYSTSDVNTFVGVEAADQPHGAAPGTLEAPLSVQTGAATYTGTRWGDYSGAAMDPDGVHVWVAAEYSHGASADWGTAAAELFIQPSISSVSPSSGPFSGGQSVTINGQDFLPGATVQFGSAPPQGASFVSNGQLATMTPPGLGTVDVTVTNPLGISATAAHAYTYNPAPFVQYFTWFDRISSPGFQGDNVHVINPGPGPSATVVVNIPGSPGCLSKGVVAPQGEQIFTCPTGFGGPVTVNSDQPVLASQRVQYFQSFNEVVAQALSAAQTTLDFTWFDRISSPGFQGDNVHVINPGAAAASVNVVIPGQPGCNPSGTIPGGGEAIFTCSSGFGGPVKVTSDQPVLASQRVQYFQSFNEVLGQAPSAAQTTLDFTWFDRISSPGFQGDNVHVINPGAAAATVSVAIPGQPACSPGGTIPGGGEAIFTCASGFGGPVKVTSDQPVLASQRVQYFQSFNEVLAQPLSAARTTLYFTWFDRISSPGFQGDNVHVINPGGTPVNVSVTIPGQPGCNPSGTIPSGGEAIFTCSTGFGGPVKVTSDQPVMVSQRVQYFQSFNEVLGLAP
jgi:hypothetical protein